MSSPQTKAAITLTFPTTNSENERDIFGALRPLATLRRHELKVTRYVRGARIISSAADSSLASYSFVFDFSPSSRTPRRRTQILPSLLLTQRRIISEKKKKRECTRQLQWRPQSTYDLPCAGFHENSHILKQTVIRGFSIADPGGRAC